MCVYISHILLYFIYPLLINNIEMMHQKAEWKSWLKWYSTLYVNQYLFAVCFHTNFIVWLINIKGLVEMSAKIIFNKGKILQNVNKFNGWFPRIVYYDTPYVDVAIGRLFYRMQDGGFICEKCKMMTITSQFHELKISVKFNIKITSIELGLRKSTMHQILGTFPFLFYLSI